MSVTTFHIFNSTRLGRKHERGAVVYWIRYFISFSRMVKRKQATTKIESKEACGAQQQPRQRGGGNFNIAWKRSDPERLEMSRAIRQATFSPYLSSSSAYFAAIPCKAAAAAYATFFITSSTFWQPRKRRHGRLSLPFFFFLHFILQLQKNKPRAARIISVCVKNYALWGPGWNFSLKDVKWNVYSD